MKALQTTTIPAILCSIVCLSITSTGQTTGSPYGGLAAAPPSPPPQVSLPQTQSPLLASIPQGQPTPGVMQLSLLQALEMGLRNNLGIILSGYTTESAQAARLKSLADLLPNVTTFTSWTSQQINLAAYGFTFPGTPQIVGPFHVFDARAYATQTLDFNLLDKYRSSSEAKRATGLSAQDTRELVVLIVGELYLAAIADSNNRHVIDTNVLLGDSLNIVGGNCGDLVSIGIPIVCWQVIYRRYYRVAQQRLWVFQR